MVQPTLEEIARNAGRGNTVSVYRDIVADLETPVSLYLKLNRNGGSFLLESVEGGQRLARYSFIGAGPYPLIAPVKTGGDNPLALISSALGGYRLISSEGMPRFCGGAVGYLGYDAIRHFEKLPLPDSDSINLPEFLFMLVDTVVVFDHVTHSIRAITHFRTDETNSLEEAYKKASAKLADIAATLEQPLSSRNGNGRKTAAVAAQTPVSNFSRENFEAAVEDAKKYIEAGEAIQVVLSQRFSQPCPVPSFEIYRALRSLNPSPYMFFFDFGDFQVLGASPEILVRVEQGMVMTRPLAGTRPRGSDEEEDVRMETELKGDEKERAEHIMLVDLGRNDIGRVSQPGTMKVSELMNVERYSHVMHLVTHVQGRLKDNLTAFDALRACFPAGTVAGAPKVRAMEIISELEPERRGVYAGAAGYFSFTGDMDMAIAIRTMVVKGGSAHVQAGCGIVHDSVPSREYQETVIKAKALLRAVEVARGDPAPKGGSHAAFNR